MRVCGQCIEGNEQRDNHNAADEHMEEDSKDARLYCVEEASALRQRKLPQACPEGDGGAKSCDPAKAAARRTGLERGVNHHDGHAGEREDDLGKDAVDVRNWIHRWPSTGREAETATGVCTIMINRDSAGGCGGCTPVWIASVQSEGMTPITSMSTASGVSTVS